MKAKIGKIIIAVLTAAVIAAIVIYVRNNWQDFSIIAALPADRLLLYICLSFLAMVINGLSTKSLASAVGANLGAVGWLGVKMVSGLIDTILPLRMGSVFAALQYKRAYKINYSSYISIVAGSTVIGTVCQLAVVILALGLISVLGIQQIDAAAVIILALTIAAIMLVLFIMYRFKDSDMVRVPLKKYIQPVFRGFWTLMENKRVVAWQILLNIWSLLVIACMYLVSFSMLGLPVDFLAALLYSAIMHLLSFFVILPGNWGINELLLGTVALILGESFNDGMLLSLLNRLACIILYISFSMAFIYPVLKLGAKNKSDKTTITEEGNP